MVSSSVRILAVDDEKIFREVLSRLLSQQGHEVTTAEDGFKALNIVAEHAFDIILLDMQMPGLNGDEILQQLKNDPKSSHIPVIMISAVDEIHTIVKCIEIGAEDYIIKPFNAQILKARISARIERKWFRDQERSYFKELQNEREKVEQLLLNILPQAIAHRLKQGESLIADYFPDVTILFADIVHFTQLTAHLASEELVEFLNSIFSEFDRLAKKYRLEKIKTIGDAYMVAGGLPNPRPGHAVAMAEMALQMMEAVKRFHIEEKKTVSVRIGIDTGPVQAGVIGTQKFCYDLWGETVNMACRMQSHCIPDHIQVSESTYKYLKDKFQFKKRGFIRIKGKGWTKPYFLLGTRT